MSADIKVFFGKFSTSNIIFEQQINEKRYYSKKGSSWFGDIKEGDYCYILAGNEVYLWKAKKYEEDYLQFESIIHDKLTIDSNKFKAFKYFILNPQIIVLTTRQVRNKAFFKIDFIDSFTEEILKNIETYKNENNFRNIIITDNNSQKNDKDIYLIKDENFKYSLFPSNFIDKKTIETFVDNSDKLGKSGKKTSRKDNTIERINNTELNHVVKDVSILSFYDLFFNQYKVEAIDESEEEIELDEKGNIKMPDGKKQTQPLNQILYGSPGTGKTYNTINKALEIIFENEDDRKKEFDFKIKDEDGKVQEPTKKTYNDILELEKVEKRKHLKGLFEYFKDEQRGQIEFVTFHQSYGYEEFVEGIKAKTSDKGIEYKIEKGIFKKLCEKASTKAIINKLDFGNPNKIWKMSLGESGSKQAKDIRQYCFDNNVIGLGFWISDVKFKGENGNEIFEEMEKEHAQNPQQYPKNTDSKIESANKTSRIKNEMKEGDIVLISGDNLKTISGIAKVTGEYKILSELREDYPDIMKGYEQVREVEWLVKNIDIPVDDYLEEGKQQLGRGTIISNNTINLEKLKALEIKSNTDKNYILIIDEINRGNISKIFGELITLIEPSKRIGADEEIKVKLPYSGDEFGVPSNLYIIGTMNTADRSIAPIDTALRRRFVFEEMAPNPDLLTEKETPNIYTDVNLKELLEAINTRIEYLYDRDHTIGHAYLIDVEDLNDLRFAFKNKIIPLLAEYFYEDWENIKLVLDDDKNRFIKVKEKPSSLNDKFKNSNKKLYSVNDIDSLLAEDFISIYSKA